MDSLQAEIADIMASISLIEEDIQKKKEQIAQSEKIWRLPGKMSRTSIMR